MDEEPTSAAELGIVLLSERGFSTPESVTHDTEQDVYFVSNIAGEPLDKDDDGFISKVTPNGEVEARFISAENEDITLHAPKGLAVVDGTLFVADIDTLRSFDAVTGEPKKSWAFPGATFLNGVKANAKGELYVSDSGLASDFTGNGSDAVYKVVDGKVRKLAAGEELGGPNGLLPADGGTWVVTFRSGELYWLSDTGEVKFRQELPEGQNDGIVQIGGERLLISSWQGASILEGTVDGTFVEVVSGVKAPADIGYDHQRQRLLVPLFQSDQVLLHSYQPQGIDSAPESKPLEADTKASDD